MADKYRLSLELFEVRLMIEPEIAACSKNRVVEQLLPIINSSVMTFATITHRMLKEETLETHRAITEAIKKKDAVGAKCAMTMHLTYNRQMLRESSIC